MTQAQDLGKDGRRELALKYLRSESSMPKAKNSLLIDMGITLPLMTWLSALDVIFAEKNAAEKKP